MWLVLFQKDEAKNAGGVRVETANGPVELDRMEASLLGFSKLDSKFLFFI